MWKLLLIPFMSFSQVDSIYIIKEFDDMTNKYDHYPSRDLKLVGTDGKGIVLSSLLDEDGWVSNIYCQAIGSWGCNENDEMTIMFSDSSRIVLKSQWDYNCDGVSLFYFIEDSLFRNSKILKIRYRNGRTYESFTSKIPKKNQDYFRQLFFASDNKRFKLKK